MAEIKTDVRLAYQVIGRSLEESVVFKSSLGDINFRERVEAELGLCLDLAHQLTQGKRSIGFTDLAKIPHVSQVALKEIQLKEQSGVLPLNEKLGFCIASLVDWLNHHSTRRDNLKMEVYKVLLNADREYFKSKVIV